MFEEPRGQRLGLIVPALSMPEVRQKGERKQCLGMLFTETPPAPFEHLSVVTVWLVETPLEEIIERQIEPRLERARVVIPKNAPMRLVGLKEKRLDLVVSVVKGIEDGHVVNADEKAR